jgi:hypothetical protein
MSKKLLILLVVAGMAVLFASTGIYAGTKVADTFKMDTKEYAKHKKGLVEFTHKKHAEDYKLDCGVCHHDDKGKALKLKMGDDVQRCVDCHTETQKVKGEKLKKKDKIKKYQQDAVHANCITCHKDHNKSLKDPKDPKGTKGPAPASCKKCHPKTKK